MSFRLSLQTAAFFLIILAVFSQKPTCMPPPNIGLSAVYDTIPNFQSGTAKLENSRNGQRYNRYNVSLSVLFDNSSYDLAISIENIYSFVPQQGYDFFVNGIKRATMIEVVLTIDVATSWSYTKVYYLVSGRPDFIVGQFVADNTAFLAAPTSNSLVTLRHHKAHSINASSEYLYVIPFIRGLRTFDLFVNFSFSSARYNPANDSLTISLKVSSPKTPIETLYLSYLIFDMESDLEITSFSSLSYAPSSVNVFVGVSGMAPSSNLAASLLTGANKLNTTKPLLGSASAIQENFDLIFGINGVIVQTQQSMDLLFRSLSPSNQTAVEVIQCVSKSKCNSMEGTMAYQQNNVFNINSKCLVCMSNGFYNQTSGACQCVQGYALNNNSCIRISDSCKENSHYSIETLSCVCNNLYVNISGSCVSIYSACPVGQIYLQGKCIRIVYANANTANCSSDSLFINKICVKKKLCSPPFQLNLTTNQCDCPLNTRIVQSSCVPCGLNEVLVGSTCQCKPTFFRIQGKCLACSQNAYFNGNTCVCFRSYSGDGFKCVQTGTTSGELASAAPRGTYRAGGSRIIH